MVLRQYGLCKMLIANVTNAWNIKDGRKTAKFQFPCLSLVSGLDSAQNKKNPLLCIAKNVKKTHIYDNNNANSDDIN